MGRGTHDTGKPKSDEYVACAVCYDRYVSYNNGQHWDGSEDRSFKYILNNKSRSRSDFSITYKHIKRHNNNTYKNTKGEIDNAHDPKRPQKFYYTIDWDNGKVNYEINTSTKKQLSLMNFMRNSTTTTSSSSNGSNNNNNTQNQTQNTNIFVSGESQLSKRPNFNHSKKRKREEIANGVKCFCLFFCFDEQSYLQKIQNCFFANCLFLASVFISLFL